jgi:hypothetical protein
VSRAKDGFKRCADVVSRTASAAYSDTSLSISTRKRGADAG